MKPGEPFLPRPPKFHYAITAPDIESCFPDLHPDIFSFGTALTACSREKQWEATLELLQDLL